MNKPISKQTVQQAWPLDWLALLADRDLPTDPVGLRHRTHGSRVRQLEITAGTISAEVLSQKAGNCTVSIELPILSDDQWSDALDSFVVQGSDQRFLEQVPVDFVSAFLKADVHLLPATLDDFTFVCSCCAPDETLCPALLTTYLAVAEMLADDPWLLLRLRGRDQQQLLAEFNQLQSEPHQNQLEQPDGAQPAYVYRAGTAQHDETPPLHSELEHFWGRSRLQLDFQHHIASPHIELVLLRRLGPPTFAENSFDLYDNLAEVYRRVTEAALTLAYRPDDDRDVDDSD